MGVNTRGSVYFKEPRGKYHDAFDFETISHYVIKKVICQAQLKEKDIAFVLGCGKGRVVCHLARRNLHKVVGVEISSTLASVTQENVQKLRGRHAPVEICNADVASTNLSKGNIFFMFNPFGAETLEHVIENIQNSHNISRSRIIIIYVNAIYAHVFKKFPWLMTKQDYYRSNGQRVVIYQNNINGA
jgi:predicted RNA methylase